MTIRAVDCQGFAGGFALGVVQAGLKLVGKREMGKGFGVANCEANRHLLGNDWHAESCDPAAWTVPFGGAEVVFGNPPCSGFSGMSNKEFRGINSPINHCMWAFVEYAARVKPLIAIFESVRAAYTKGHPLMRDLRARLEARTGTLWTLYHVVHDAYALGGPAIRRRYFWVASRIPFGVEHPELPIAPTLYDAIGDLETLTPRWEAQPYPEYTLDGQPPPLEWAHRLRAQSGRVDGHATVDNPHAKRLADLAQMIDWQQGESVSSAARRCYEQFGHLPASWKNTEAHVVKRDFNFGFSSPVRWSYAQPGRVVTGAGPNIGLHPTLPRTFTHREIARILGFPDDWLIEPLKGTPGLTATWGKGITVDAGRWIAYWARASIEGAPGSLPWTEVGSREFEVVVNKPRVYGRVYQAPQPMSQNGVVLNMTAPTPPVPPAPVVPTPQAATQPAAAAPAEQASQAVSASTETTSASKEKSGRGRPRPADVVARDEAVLAAVTADGVTREQIAKSTGIDSVRVYQSLWRLRRDGLVVRGRNGRAHYWMLASAAGSETEAKAESDATS